MDRHRACLVGGVAGDKCGGGSPSPDIVLRSEAGFTLAEVVAAILILAVVMLGVSGMLYVGWLNTQRGGSSTVALNLAQEKLEEVKENPGSAVNVVGGTFPSVSGYTYNLSVEDQDDDGLATVTVAVYYQVRSINQEVSLTTMVRKP